MGRAGGAVERLDDEIAWTIGGSPLGYHNAVVRCTASEGRSGFLVEEWRDALRQRSLPGSWHWTPGMHPHDLPRLLLDAGFEDGGDEPAMAAQLAALADVPMATELQVTPVEDSSALDEYRQVLAAGFGEGPKEADWVASVFAIIGLEPHSRWRHFVGTVADDPVATASTLLTDSTAGIYFVCTRPDARRRGFGAAITYKRCATRRAPEPRSPSSAPRRWGSAFTSGSDSEPFSPPGSSSWTRSSPSQQRLRSERSRCKSWRADRARRPHVRVVCASPLGTRYALEEPSPRTWWCLVGIVGGSGETS